jgi:ribose transport system substrate-binding protein
MKFSRAKAPPWRIGVSFPGVGNTWLVQAIAEMKYEASLHKEIGEFIFTEADWKTTKQVADVEDLLTKRVDALIVAPIAVSVLADQVAKAKTQRIVVVAYGSGAIVNKRPRLTPPSLGRSIAWLADRRRDPAPINR